jgi:hypothetical protein
MKKLWFAMSLSLLLMVAVAGCGGSSGGGGIFGGSETTSGTATAGSVTLAWDAPVGSDGMPLSNISGYNVHYGTSPGYYGKTVNNGTRTICTISGLAPGTYYFAVTCYDSSGNESTFSNEAVKNVQ